jgi:putative endonuclease
MLQSSYIYIMANKRNGTLYVGVTTDLPKRVYEHREGITKGFTARYGIKRLVYYEIHAALEVAIQRESQIKAWKRAWKIELIEKFNPSWDDLYATLV